MGIGPGDWSEEVHPPMTIDSCQNENNTEGKKSCKMSKHLTQKPWTPWNKWSDVTTAGTNMNLHTGDLRCPLEWARAYITQGRFHPPLHPFLNFHLCNMLIRVLYNKHTQIQILTSKQNPHLFILHHSCIGLTLHNMQKLLLLYQNVPNPPSYRH